MTGPPTESGDTPPRKRIAVACGRCRKRKIRCSGDPGGGQSCSNCKNAGVEPCQFLRVSSQEAPLRGNDFDYDTPAARSYANRGSVPPPTQYTGDLGSGDLMSSYRSGTVFPYTSRSYYGAAAGSYGGYADDGYGLGYSGMGQDANHMVPYSWRVKQESSAAMYVDPDAGYSYGNSSNLVRTPVSDSPGFSMSSFSAALPSAGADRHLPTPSSAARNMASSALASTACRTDGLPYKAHAIAGSGVASPNSPVSDAATAGYSGGVQSGAVDPSPMTAYSPSGAALSGHHRPSYGSADVYNTGEAMFSEQERSSLGTQGGGVEMSGFSYGGGGSSTTSALRRGSSASGPGGPSSASAPGYGDGPHLQTHHEHLAAIAGLSGAASYVADSAATAASGSGHGDGHRGSGSIRR